MADDASLGIDNAHGDLGARRRSSGRRGHAFGSLTNRDQAARLDEILEGARERAEGLTPTDQLSPQPSEHNDRRNMDTSRSSNDGVQPNERTALKPGTSQSSIRGLSSAVKSHRNSLGGGSSERVPANGTARQQRSRDTEDEVDGDDNEGEQREESWGKKLFGRFQSVELENKGSVARDHLALERTFLAWLRTSLAFASIGIAVTQLFRLNTSLTESTPNDGGSHALRHMGKPLGATFLGISILTLLLGYRRYLQGQEWVIKGKFPASRGTVIILVAMSFAIMVVSLVVVIVIHPTEKAGL